MSRISVLVWRALWCQSQTQHLRTRTHWAPTNNRSTRHSSTLPHKSQHRETHAAADSRQVVVPSLEVRLGADMPHERTGGEMGERCWGGSFAKIASYSDQEAQGSSNLRETYLMAAHLCCLLLPLRDILLWLQYRRFHNISYCTCCLNHDFACIHPRICGYGGVKCLVRAIRACDEPIVRAGWGRAHLNE